MTIEKVLKTATQLGFSVKGLTFSPIKGGAGNVEFLVHLLKDGKAEIAQQVNKSCYFAIFFQNFIKWR